MNYVFIIVFDIDGTLANIEHRRHYVSIKPKNWKAFNEAMKFDSINKDILFLLNTFKQNNHKIILCSGRSEETRKITENWLELNNVHYEQLYMRSEKDYRKDSIVKVELLQKIKEEHGNPYFWFDDRNQVVDAIREQGIRVLQVAPGNF